MGTAVKTPDQHNRFAKMTSRVATALRFCREFDPSGRRSTALSVAAATVSAMLLLPLAPLLRRLLANESASVSYVVADVALIILVLAMTTGFRLLAVFLGLRVTKEVACQLRKAIVAKLYIQPAAIETPGGIGGLRDLLADDVDRCDNMSALVLTEVLPGVLATVMIAVAILWLDPLLGILALIALPLAVAIFAGTRRPIRLNLEIYHAASLRLGQDALRAARRIRLARLTDSIGQERQVLGEAIERLTKTGMWAAWIAHLSNSCQSFVAFVAGITVLAIGRLKIDGGSLTVADLVVFYVLATLMRNHLLKITSSVPAILAGLVAYGRIIVFLDSKPARRWTGAEIAPLPQSIQAVGIGNSVGGRLVLKDVSITLQMGEVVGLTGANGSGKSMVADILSGLIVPDHGDVRLDGESMSRIDGKRVLSKIAYLSQMDDLFDGTLRENITFGVSNLPDETVKEALALVGAAELAESPEGLDFKLCETGARLSGGERRRVSLARALLRSPRFLILDEPSNHIGLDGADRLIESILTRFPDLGVLLISHEPNLLKRAVRVHTLADGRLV
jgi:ATP-binding cassette subfamily B protein